MLIQVDNAITYQTIDGFGANTLSLVFPNGDHLGPLRERAVKAAFGEVRLSLGLLNIGIVETPAGATDLFGQRAKSTTVTPWFSILADSISSNPTRSGKRS